MPHSTRNVTNVTNIIYNFNIQSPGTPVVGKHFTPSPVSAQSPQNRQNTLDMQKLVIPRELVKKVGTQRNILDAHRSFTPKDDGVTPTQRYLSVDLKNQSREFTFPKSPVSNSQIIA